jgi:hypothetical protein
MGFSGSRYTWSNKQHDVFFTKERLDRVVANSKFASLFPQLIVEVLPARTSDHAHLLVSLKGLSGRNQSGCRLFKFEVWWQKKQGFPCVVKQVWKVKTRHLDTWGALKNKISHSKQACLQWRKNNVDPTANLIEKKTLELGVLQGEGEASDMSY